MRKGMGYLLIHGFGGNIEELSPLALQLREEGNEVRCPQLKGHTGVRNDLKGVRYQDWISSAEESLKELLATCETVYIVGFSMGGLIGINLASRHQIGGMVTLNTPIYYWDAKRILSNIFLDIRKKDFKNLRLYFRSCNAFPLSALLNFRMLLNETKPLIKEVRCPVFIAQALEDDTVRKSSGIYLYENIVSQKKALKFYENSGHLILWSEIASQVIQDIRNFLN